MDNTKKPPSVLSLCTGYGGLELGLERALGPLDILAHVEIEAFAVANLVNKMETGKMVPVPIWTDIKTFDASIFRGRVDIVTGGYPCQPFSTSGNRRGADDPRHLWPHIARIIKACEPGQVFLENVEGHLSLGVDQVLSDLEGLGYRPTAGIFSAAEVGGTHIRKRVFILAHHDSGDIMHSGRMHPRVHRQAAEPPETAQPGGSGSRRPRWGGDSKPGLDRLSNGTPNRVDRLRLLGNGVVPAVAEVAYTSLFRKLVSSW